MDQATNGHETNKDTVTLKADYIDVVWDGPQNKDKVAQSNLNVQKVAQDLKSQNKPMLMLFRIYNHPPNADLGAFKEVLKIFDAVQFDRIAVGGDIPHIVMSLVSTVASSFNKNFDMKYFDNEDEAISWLREFKK